MREKGYGEGWLPVAKDERVKSGGRNLFYPSNGIRELVALPKGENRHQTCPDMVARTTVK